MTENQISNFQGSTIISRTFKNTISALKNQGKYIFPVYSFLFLLLVVFFYFFINSILVPLFSQIDIHHPENLINQSYQILDNLLNGKSLQLFLIMFNYLLFQIVFFYLTILLIDIFLKKSININWNFSYFLNFLKMKFSTIIFAAVLLLLIQYIMKIAFSFAVSNAPQISILANLIIFALMRFFIFTIPVIFQENMSSFQSIKRSAKLVYYHFGKILIYSSLFILFWLIISVIIIFIISFLLAGILSFYQLNWKLIPIPIWIIFGIFISFILYPLMIFSITSIHSFYVELYFSQRKYFENFDPEKMEHNPIVDIKLDDEDKFSI